MELLGDVSLRDRALYFDDVLVIADVHLGKRQSSNVELPVGSGQDVVDRIELLCRHFEPAVVVIVGDLLHSFDTVPHMVTETVRGIERVLDANDVDAVVTPGNHDTLLDAVWSHETTPEYRVGDTIICHGHVRPEQRADRYVIGHDHPTISIEGQSHPCYLVGEGVYNGSDLIVLPAFNRLIKGVTVNDMSAADFMSPLVTDTDGLAPIVRDEAGEETLRFPPLGRFRHKL